MLKTIGEIIRQMGRRWARPATAEGLEHFEQSEMAGKSQAEAAEEIGLPRSTLRYWKKRKAEIQGPEKEVCFFESPEGLVILHKICTAIHFVTEFTSHRGVRGVCEFLELSGLSKYVASSYGAQQKVALAMEDKLAHYGKSTRERLGSGMSPKKITVCEDETFHPEICLVGVEPVSGFILLEEYADQRDAKTWNAEISKALEGLPVEVIQSTSDEAKGILAHVRNGLGAHHSPDLFHPLREIGKGIFPRLNALLKSAQATKEAASRQLHECRQAAKKYWEFPAERSPGRPPDFQKHIESAEQAEANAEQAVRCIDTYQNQVREALQGISDAYHPFDLKTGQMRSVETVKADIQRHFATFDYLSLRIDLAERGKGYIQKARQLIPQFLATLTFVFTTIKASMEELAVPEHAKQVILQQLIPGIYLRTAAAKATTVEKRRAIETTAETLLAPFRSENSPLAGLSTAELQQVERIAIECANLFQRSSSCVEGRNGHLALWHHYLHKLRARRLQALTVVQNYFIRHPDGQTSAQRFFGTQHENLFDWLLGQIPPPSRPAHRRPRPSPQPLLAAA